jgi:hypothetical protein
MRDMKEFDKGKCWMAIIWLSALNKCRGCIAVTRQLCGPGDLGSLRSVHAENLRPGMCMLKHIDR